MIQVDPHFTDLIGFARLLEDELDVDPELGSRVVEYQDNVRAILKEIIFEYSMMSGHHASKNTASTVPVPAGLTIGEVEYAINLAFAHASTHYEELTPLAKMAFQTIINKNASTQFLQPGAISSLTFEQRMMYSKFMSNMKRALDQNSRKETP